ncbi:MAG: molybdenum cofactor biosynthesis protein MoaE [Acidobacteria bacterium]|nr:MAG: molybdenum cofactor biosynthesis protein MoaE [Acidobacteriota bacterium]
MPLLAVTREPLSVEKLSADVAALSGAEGEGCGAVTSFAGLVRAHHQGRAVTHLEYEAYEPLALKSFEQIRREAKDQWPGVVLGLHHRIGRLEIGEASIVIAAAAAHRAAAFEVCRYVIERVKQIAPIWKHEYFSGGGDAWVEGAVADPNDAAARELARARACASA